MCDLKLLKILFNWISLQFSYNGHMVDRMIYVNILMHNDNKLINQL